MAQIRISPPTIDQAEACAKELIGFATTGTLTGNVKAITADTLTVAAFAASIEPGWPDEPQPATRFAASKTFEELHRHCDKLRVHHSSMMGAGIGGGVLLNLLISNLPSIVQSIIAFINAEKTPTTAAPKA